MKVEITSLKLKLKDREIELTIEEARAIYKEFDALFKERDTQIIPMPYPVEREPMYPTPSPIWYDSGSKLPFDHWKIMCDGNEKHSLNMGVSDIHDIT